jgi:hypothetical protein
MGRVSTPEVNSLASTIKTLPFYGVFSLDGEWQATLLYHRCFPYLTMLFLYPIFYFQLRSDKRSILL